MSRSLLYTALTLVVTAAGVANWRHESLTPPLARSRAVEEPRLANCEEAIAVARRSPYWRTLEIPEIACRQAPGGWRLNALDAQREQSCELYVGRDRLIVPHLPCQGVGKR
jgi:hypothetical protein